MAEPWSEREVDRVIDVYFSMLSLELAGETYNKSVFRSELLHDVDRSPSSAEYKFRNVSAVLAELGAVFVDGYKPARNVQQLLHERVTERFAAADDLRQSMLHAVKAEPTAVDSVLTAPSPVPDIPDRPKTSRPRHGVFADYQQMEAANRSLGLAGERAVVDFERRRLEAAGRQDLSERVAHVSVEQGDGLGFDVLSFTPEGIERFLEVKTTRYSPHQPFLATRNEVDFSAEEPNRFALVRVFRFESERVGHYELPGSLRVTASLSPTVYEGVPRHSA